MFFVYLDRTNDGRVFYVGKGKHDRVSDFLRKNVVKNTIVFRVYLDVNAKLCGKLFVKKKPLLMKYN